MIAKSDLEQVVQYQAQMISSGNNVVRNLEKNIKKQSDLISIITGVRRCGKSTLMRRLMQRHEQCHYLNFEDFRLAGFEHEDFRTLEKLFAEKKPGCTTYFFDEIQNVDGWENYARTLNDEGKTIFITGSNASLLSIELGSKLTGRHLQYELFPMDFFEYCNMKEVDATDAAVDAYLVDGGFPQYLKTAIPEYLQQIINDILYRDIVKRYSVRNIAVLEDLTKFLISNISKEYSLRNISRMMNTYSIHTLSEFIRYLEDAYLFFTVPVFSFSLKRQSVNPHKIYSIDNGLAAANSFQYTKDKGKLFENAVFLSLRRRFKNIFYFKKRGECDFVVSENSEVKYVIQACYMITGENLKRELNGLEEAMQDTDCKNAIIITRSENGEYRNPSGMVRVVSLFAWFEEIKRAG